MMSDQSAVKPTLVPAALRAGVPMLKISSKKIKQVVIRIEDGAITWGIKGSRVPIAQIRELRLNQPPSDTYAAERWITVVYALSAQWKVLHMSALTDDVYSLWVDTLTGLVSETSDRLVAQVTPADPDLMWIRQLWPAGAKMIDFGTAAGLCGSLGLVIPRNIAEKYNKEPLDLAAFRKLAKEAQTRPELDRIYSELSTDGPPDQDRVEHFLRETQHLEPNGIFDQFKRDDIWTVDSLTEFLLSPLNTQSQAIDMTKPLPEYFVSSSHNTYLVGEQWRGESTVEGYIRVLLARGRCVEMDCHNGEYEPEVYHKKTLTSRVSVREICQAINKYAFITSPYPVIISAEIHCSLEQQEQIGAIMADVFGDRLITALIDGIGGMPSPEQLREKILFKAKPPTEKQARRVEPPSIDSTSSTESDSGFARLARRLSLGSNNSDRPLFSSSLSDLLVYSEGVKYQGFSKLVEYAPHQQFSVSERAASKIVKENKADWIKHNFTHISRVYPRGFRLGSSNYDPIPFWSAGAQIVALNWQTLDEGCTLNHALFSDTPGYVLKPPALRSKLNEPVQRYRLSVEIISAQRLPITSDLYVEATLCYGSPETPPIQRTSVIRGKTLNPTWSEILRFERSTTTSMLDLTFLHLQIKSGKTMLAQWMRPLSRSPAGYHHLPLYDSLFSKYVFATLFVRIDLETVV